MSTPVPDPDAHHRDLLRYRRNLIVVAIISVVSGIVMGVFAIAPLRQAEVAETLVPPVLRTAVPLATQALITQEPLVGTEPALTAPASRTTGIELETSADATLLDINTATAEQLETLPGIGETRAQDIIAYRETHGDFASIEDITQVNGIGDGTLEKIAPYITVGLTQD